MNFEFFKLANVDENSVVTENTYSLVVNGDDVQKTKNNLIKSKFYKNFTEDYIEWRDQQQTTQRKNIKKFVKTLISSDSTPYKGYIETPEDGTALFEVIGTLSDSKQHLEVFYETTVDGQLSKCIDVYDFYNSETVSSNTYMIVGNEIHHLDNSDYFKSKNIINSGTLENIGNSKLNGNLEVDNNVEIDGTLKVNNSSNNSFIEINGHNINLHSQNTEIYLEHSDDENLTLSGSNNSSVEIRGISNPTVGTAAANKNYVDNKIEQLNGRIDNLTIGGDNAEAEEIVTFITEPVQISSSYTADTSVTLSETNIKLISFEWAFNTSTTVAWRTDNLSMTSVNGDETSISLNVYDINNYYIQSNFIIFKIVYSRKATLNIPELTDLRTPFSPGQVIKEYDSRQSYLEGEKVIYNGHYYICVQDARPLLDIPGQSQAWEILTVSARANIQNALAGTLKADNVRFIDENLSITVGGTTLLQNNVLYPAYGLSNGDYLLGKNGVVAVISQFNKTSDTEYQATATTLFVITAAGSGNLPSSSVEDVGKFLQVDSSGSAAWVSVPNAESETY